MPLKSIEKEKSDSDTSFVLFGLFISNRPRIMTWRQMGKGSRRGGKREIRALVVFWNRCIWFWQIYKTYSIFLVDPFGKLLN